MIFFVRAKFRRNFLVRAPKMSWRGCVSFFLYCFLVYRISPSESFSQPRSYIEFSGPNKRTGFTLQKERYNSPNSQCLKMATTHGPLGHLSLLGVLRKLRCGNVHEMKEVNFPGCLNRSYKFKCENGDFFVKINDDNSAQQMFEGEAAGLKVCSQIHHSPKH